MKHASKSAALAAKCAAIVDLRARRIAALGVMRAAAHEGSYVTWDTAIMAASAKSWIRSCGLSGDTFARTLTREYVTQHKGRGASREIF